MAVANQAGVRKLITSSRLPPTMAKITSMNVNMMKDRIIRHRWHGPDLASVRV